MYVPQDIQRPLGVPNLIPQEGEVVPRGSRFQLVEAESVPAVFLGNVPRCEGVAPALREGLLPFGGPDPTVHQDTIVRAPIEGHHARPQLRVEPAPRLVVGFRYEG